MTNISSIPVAVEPLAPLTGNVLPLLHELRHALARLKNFGETTVIDLRSLPISAEESAQLDDLLDTGEVFATLEALGESLIEETGIPGIWRIRHFDRSGELALHQLEVTSLPEILKTQTEDLAGAEFALTQIIQGLEK